MTFHIQEAKVHSITAKGGLEDSSADNWPGDSNFKLQLLLLVAFGCQRKYQLILIISINSRQIR